MRLPKLLFPFFFSLLLAAACHHTQVTGVETGSVVMDGKSGSRDSATAAILLPYKDSLDKLMNVVVGYSDVAMPKEREKLETLLGNFVADVCLQEGNRQLIQVDKGLPRYAQLCLFNNGGLRSSLPQGNITRGNIFELMPFDNEIVIVTLTGKKTWDLLRYLAASGGQPVAGLKMGIKPDKTPGTVLIQGQPFDSTKTYMVMTSDYLANGGDKMDFFRNPLQLETTGLKIRDALLEYCMTQKALGKTIHPVPDGRLYYETK
jgi:2',3'-cyclic-nucleotide 2'-phosphodiesterase (5'-nucleotidase family)